MKVLVFGLGRSGLAVCELLAKQNHDFVVFDDSPKRFELDKVLSLGGRPGVTLEAALLNEIDICIAAPGVPYHHPKLLHLRKAGIETIGEVEWVFRTLNADIIGITGTAGKTSVTQWLSQVLIGAGLDAVAGGNIDPALSQVAAEHKLLVTELSSFQLERCPTLKPRIAIVLNLASDHLDRHGSLETYHQAKYAITQNQTKDDLLIYNADDELLSVWAQKSHAQTLGFSTQKPADAYLSTEDGQTYLILGKEKLLTSSELHIQGEHQLANALAVALAARALGVKREAILTGLQAFKGVAGRYALAGKVADINFIEDSIATRSLAVKAALQSTQAPIVWIAGGADKGANFDDLASLIKERVSLFVGMGESAEAFAKQASVFTATHLCSEKAGADALRCAVQIGIEHLQTHHQAKGTILLAPLAASFDQFQDYKERAMLFRQIVAEVEQQWTSY